MPGVVASLSSSQDLVGSPEAGRAITGTLRRQIYRSVCTVVSPAFGKEAAIPPIGGVVPRGREETVG